MLDDAATKAKGLQRHRTTKADPMCCAEAYNGGMARGWESKSVESQIESAETKVRPPAAERISAKEMELLRRKESLNLSRIRVLRELEASQNPRYRVLMEKALADLNSELTSLDRGAVRVATA